RCFVYRERSIDTLPQADADATFPVADDDDKAKIETAAAGHHARHAPRIDSDLIELAPLARRARAAAAARRTAANRPATTLRRRCCRSNNFHRSGLRWSNSFFLLYDFRFHWCSHRILKCESSRARGIRKRLHLAAITIASAIKDRGLHARLFSLFCNRRADRRRLH
ncbi:MAG: hypothetical protein G01um101449_435, partial [Parcubacteria group bacterium Gr01-1014_49]